MFATSSSCVSPDMIPRYIPHRAPFLMVDSLYPTDTDEMVGGLTIQSDNVLVSDGHFLEAGILEHMAQVMALRQGYVHGTPNRELFFVSLRNARFHRQVPVGKKILTRIELLSDQGDLLTVRASSYAGRQLVAECELLLMDKVNEPVLEETV